jgi:tetratricopeptide (TPR) repeat protein
VNRKALYTGLALLSLLLVVVGVLLYVATPSYSDEKNAYSLISFLLVCSGLLLGAFTLNSTQSKQQEVFQRNEVSMDTNKSPWQIAHEQHQGVASSHEEQRENKDKSLLMRIGGVCLLVISVLLGIILISSDPAGYQGRLGFGVFLLLIGPIAGGIVIAFSFVKPVEHEAVKTPEPEIGKEEKETIAPTETQSLLSPSQPKQEATVGKEVAASASTPLQASISQHTSPQELQKQDEMLLSLKQDVENDPQSYEAWTNLGYRQHELGQNNEALTSANKAIELNRNYAPGWAVRAMALSTVDGHEEEALFACNQALAIDPTNIDALYYKEKVRRKQSEKDTLRNRRGSIAGFIDRIDALREAGEHNQAIALCQDFLSTNPRSVDVMLALIKVYTDLDDKDREIITLATNILKIDPRNAEAYYYIGEAKFALHDDKGAEQAFNEAIAIDPEYVQALSMKAMSILYPQRRYQEMLAIGRDLVDFAPHKGYGYQIQAWAYNDLATQSQDEDYLELAIARCEQAIRLEPEVVGAYHILADIYYKQGKYVAALETVDTALRIDPNDELALRLRAEIEKQMRKERRKGF